MAKKIYHQELTRAFGDELERLSAIYSYLPRTKKVSLGRRRVPVAMELAVAQTVKIRHAG